MTDLHGLSRSGVLLIPAVALALLSGTMLQAEARPARCFATDEGRYACDFTSLNRDGSFRISAAGKATYILNMTEPGVADGFLNLGQRNVSLPERFLRSKEDRACWDNDTTKVRFCVW